MVKSDLDKLKCRKEPEEMSVHKCKKVKKKIERAHATLYMERNSFRKHRSRIHPYTLYVFSKVNRKLKAEFGK